MTRILLADDHRVMREGLRRILTEKWPRAAFGEASTVAETLRLLRQGPWDILVLDVFMPGGGGLEVLRQVVANHPQVPVLVLSSAPEEQLAVRMLRDGAAGYLNKQVAAEELVHAVQKVLGGGRYLSPQMADVLLQECTRPAQMPHQKLTGRELQVLQMIATGKSFKEIAADLGLSPKTISTFHTRILHKLRLRNTVELVHYALEHHLTERAVAARAKPK